MSGGKPKRHILRRGFEDKVWAALRVETGCSRSEVGADMDVAESTLRGWIHEKTIHDHARELDCIIHLTLMKESPKFCRDDVYDPEYLTKDVFDRVAGLGRFKKGSMPMWTPDSCSSGASTSSSAPVTPSTSRSGNLYQCTEASLSHVSRKRLHSEGYNTDGSSSSSTAEYHQEKKQRIDVSPQYHLDITMRLNNQQANYTGAGSIDNGNVTSLQEKEGR